MTSPYAKNERVLCYHGPLIYEAKVLETEHHESPAPITGKVGWHYFVHYKGWKDKWDEWVEEARLLKHGEEGLQTQKDLLKQHKKEPSGSNTKSSKAGASSSAAAASGRGARKDGARGTKRARDEDDFSRRPEMKLNMPETLKHMLVDDWEAVTKNMLLVPLPRTPSVFEILEQWRMDILSDPQNRATPLKDPPLLLPTIVSGIQVYFEKAIGANLLYRQERLQYSETRKQYVTGQNVRQEDVKQMGEIYGAEHLVRLLVSMPGIIQHSAIDMDSVNLIKEYVNDLLAWLTKEKGRLFVTEYETPSPQYSNVAKT